MLVNERVFDLRTGSRREGVSSILTTEKQAVFEARVRRVNVEGSIPVQGKLFSFACFVFQAKLN